MSQIAALYVSIREAAMMLGLSPSTLYEWSRLGRLTREHGLRRFGRRVMVEMPVLRAAIERGELS